MSLRVMAATFGWGVFLACSWTWCIGMFLPVRMIDEFGWFGLIVFALANVGGCTAFGYIMSRRADVGVFVRDHRPAMASFSVVTVAFHLFFIAFLIGDSEIKFLISDVLTVPRSAKWAPASLAAAVFAISLVLSFMPRCAWVPFAIGVYAISIATMLAVGVGAFDVIEWLGTRTPPTDLLWLLPVLIFGFVLCPYLDLTFHRALAESPSSHTFGVFGVLFSLMLLLTCLIWFGDQPGIIIVHFFAQSVFTMSAHLRELRLLQLPRRKLAVGALLLLPLLGLIVRPASRELRADRYDGEEMYLRWFVFYGLVFPAVALVFMRYGRAMPQNRRTCIVFAVAVLASAPLYEVAFFHERIWVLTIPMLVVLLWIPFRARTLARQPSPGI